MNQEYDIIVVGGGHAGCEAALAAVRWDGLPTRPPAVHFRLLNASKGSAVQATRFQCDKQLYRLAMKTVLEKEPRLHLLQGLVERLVVEDRRIRSDTWRYRSDQCVP